MHMNNTVLSQTPHQNIVATDLKLIYHACAGFIQSPVKLRTILLSIQNKKKRHKFKRKRMQNC